MIGNLLIFGDSYSTHKDHIPSGYHFYYCDGGRSPEEPVTKMTVDKTWWWQLIENTDAKLIRNDSWSGSTIGYTGYSGDCSKTSSFICRYDKLREAGLFSENKINTIIVFGGTNDSWSGAPLGEEMYEGWEREDLFSVRPAICYFMSRLKSENPEARLVFIANCDIKTEVVDCIKNAARQIGGVEVVELSGLEKLKGHPTPVGMKQIYEQVRAQLNV